MLGITIKLLMIAGVGITLVFGVTAIKEQVNAAGRLQALGAEYGR